ncbi:hypothetical protein [Longispora urticae]
MSEPLDFSEPVPVDPYESPTARRRLRWSKFVLAGCAVAVLLVAFGMWNPFRLVAAHEYLSRPCELFVILCAGLGLVYYLRQDGSQEGVKGLWTAVAIAVGVLAYVVAVRTPAPVTLAVSPDGRIEAVLWSDHREGQTGDLVLRSRRGLLSQESSAPLACAPRKAEFRFADDRTLLIVERFGDGREPAVTVATFDPDTLEPTNPTEWCTR